MRGPKLSLCRRLVASDLDVEARRAYLCCMRKQRKSAASRAGEALAALRMTKMTPEERSRVARLGGYAKAAARRAAQAEKEGEGASA